MNLVNRFLAQLDRVFLAFFELKRHKSPSEDPEIAWHSATFSVSLYLVLPFSTVIIILAGLIHVMTDIELDLQHKRYWMIGAALIFVIIGMLLDQRFKRLVTTARTATQINVRADHQVRVRFRLVTIGCFIAGCITGFVLYADRLA